MTPQLIEALTLIAYLVIVMIALGIAEICVDLVTSIIYKVKRMLK